MINIIIFSGSEEMPGQCSPGKKCPGQAGPVRGENSWIVLLTGTMVTIARQLARDKSPGQRQRNREGMTLNVSSTCESAYNNKAEVCNVRDRHETTQSQVILTVKRPTSIAGSRKVGTGLQAVLSVVAAARQTSSGSIQTLILNIVFEATSASPAG